MIPARLSFSARTLSRLVARSRISASYASSVVVISSGNPTAARRLAATRAENCSPILVTIGRPAQSASLAVVCAL